MVVVMTDSIPDNDSSDNLQFDADSSQEDINCDQEDGNNKTDKNIFEAKFELYMDNFGKVCSANNIEIAFALVVDPSQTDPIVFTRGHIYDITKTLAQIVRYLKQQINEELDC